MGDGGDGGEGFRGEEAGVGVGPAVTPGVDADAVVEEVIDEKRAFAVRLADEGDVEVLFDIGGFVDVGVGGFLAVDGAGAHGAIIGQAEFFRDEAVVVVGGDFFDEVELVGAVAVPVDGFDSPPPIARIWSRAAGVMQASV